MKKKKPEAVVEISEMTNTWGCTWCNPGGETQYGFSTWPSASSTWLGVASGDAVRQIYKAGLGMVIKTTPGAYGGTCRTVRVDRDELERACQAHYAVPEKPQSTTCHYCGMPATGTGFFDEACCPECGG